MPRACWLIMACVPAAFAGSRWIADSDLAPPPETTALDLSLTLITDAGMEKIRGLENVVDLNLASVERITDVSIAYIRNWKKLERLNLRGTDITDTSLQYIGGLTSLKSLDISYTQITNNGMEYLASLGNLEELRVGGNKVTGAGLRVLRTLPRLRALDLSGGQKRNSGTWIVTLTDPDLETIGAIAGLRELNLSGMKVTAAGLRLLAPLKNLERLSLWRATRADDAALAALAPLANLRLLDITGTPATADGVTAFRRAHPKCEVAGP